MHVAVKLNEIREQNQSALYALDHWKLLVLLGLHLYARQYCSSAF